MQSKINRLEKKVANGSGGGGGGMKLLLYPEDMKNFLKWGTLGFVGLGVYQLCMSLAKRNINPCVDFEDPVESMNCDEIIRNAMIELQTYRKLNPWIFKSALQNIDQLLFLENALLTRQIRAVPNDKATSWTFFRMALKRLNQFQFLVRQRMGNEHGLVTNLLVKKIYNQLQKHLLNILHLCSEFKPEHLIERAPLEIQRILNNYEKGIIEKDSYAKWDELRKKVDQYKSDDEKDDMTGKSSGHRRRHKRSSHKKYESRKSRESRRSRESQRSHRTDTTEPREQKEQQKTSLESKNVEVVSETKIASS
jgi:hypothetical protein